jgi:hypothetical protein
MTDTVTALQARRLRLLAGKPLAEVDRLWQLESLHGFVPQALVAWERVGESVDYAVLAQREQRQREIIAKLGRDVVAAYRASNPDDIDPESENHATNNPDGTADPDAASRSTGADEPVFGIGDGSGSEPELLRDDADGFQRDGS